jgi:hypothetical protein
MWELFSESVILQGLLTVALWGTAIFLFVTGQPVPDLLAAGCGSIMTFWFTAKTTRAVSSEILNQVATAAKALTEPKP